MSLSDRSRAFVTRVRGTVHLRSTLRKAVQEFRYRRVLRRMAGPQLVRAFADAYPDAFFVEVGSNDGERYDHLSSIIHAGAWSGIMVEPVPYVFDQLRRNYGNEKRVILENVAIAGSDTRMPFYHLVPLDESEKQRFPDWYDGLGSFVLETILDHRDKIPDLERRIVRTDVPCMTFQTLCAKHGVTRVDLVLIDTEGFDFEVIKNIDFSLHRPRLLIYEHFHLSSDQRAQCRGYLESLGYETMEEGFDTFCLDSKVSDRVTEVWRRLEPAIPGTSAETERETEQRG